MSQPIAMTEVLDALLAASPDADVRERVLAAYRAGQASRRQMTPEECGVELPTLAQATIPAPHIPQRFAAATLGNYVPKTEDQRIALWAVRTFAARAARQDDPIMLALIGSQGVGKSHLLYATARELHALGLRVQTRAWYTLADELRYGREVTTVGPTGARVEKIEPDAVRKQLFAAPILLLDEVRPTANTEFDTTELTKIACMAYDEGVSLLLTTNVNPLAQIMGPFAADRFESVVVTGQSQRRG